MFNCGVASSEFDQEYLPGAKAGMTLVQIKQRWRIWRNTSFDAGSSYDVIQAKEYN